jgi:hypothetical protein
MAEPMCNNHLEAGYKQVFAVETAADLDLEASANQFLA